MKPFEAWLLLRWKPLMRQQRLSQKKRQEPRRQCVSRQEPGNESGIATTRREIRERLGCGATVLRVHLERLCRWEYVIPQSSGRGTMAKYQLLFNGRGYEGQPTFCGLVDVSKLTDKCMYDEQLGGGKRPVGSPLAGALRGYIKSASH